MPSGFWINYQKSHLKENLSNQGGHGGYRAMHWKAEKQEAFNSKELISFAEKNDWELVDSSTIPADKLTNWTFNGKPIFPLSHTGFASSPENNSTYENFPRWINTDLKIYMFKTGWVMYEPGTNDSYDVNGFVVLNNDGSEISVYHLWGE